MAKPHCYLTSPTLTLLRFHVTCFNRLVNVSLWACLRSEGRNSEPSLLSHFPDPDLTSFNVMGVNMIVDVLLSAYIVES